MIAPAAHQVVAFSGHVDLHPYAPVPATEDSDRAQLSNLSMQELVRRQTCPNIQQLDLQSAYPGAENPSRTPVKPQVDGEDAVPMLDPGASDHRGAGVLDKSR